MQIEAIRIGKQNLQFVTLNNQQELEFSKRPPEQTTNY
jgi:hypothetical protein